MAVDDKTAPTVEVLDPEDDGPAVEVLDGEPPEVIDADGGVEVLEPQSRLGEEALARALDMYGDLSIPLTAGRADVPATADPLAAYLARLAHIVPLPPEDQQALAVRYVEEGDVNAARMLVITNLRFVVKIAREYQRRWTNLMDLIQEGNMGLMEAVKRYDPYRDVKFTSYAKFWVRAKILKHLMTYMNPVRIGSSRQSRKLFYNLKKARQELQKMGHEDVTPTLIAEHLDVDVDEVIAMQAQLEAPPIYLDATLPGDSTSTVGQVMPEMSHDPSADVERSDFNARVREVMDAFAEEIEGERDRAIWDQRMAAAEPRSLGEIGDEWDISRERVRQLEIALRKRFKDFLVARLGNEIEINFLES